MPLGTMLGGARIIKKVGGERTDLDAVGGSAADAASTAILVFCSLFGIPASTTHSKSCAIMGTGLCQRGGLNLRIAAQMLTAWILTFPACGAIGYILSRLFSQII
jgi:PiT family inorganic phosphate transporter